MIRLVITILASLLVAGLACAEPHRLSSNSSIEFDLPSDRWQVSSEPPQLAIDAMYVDLVHMKKNKGESYDPEKLRAMAVKFMQVNNLYIYNEQTEAYLMVSLSPYSEKSGKPDAAAVKKSAQWAVDAIAEHAEVDDLSGYTATVEPVEIPGIAFSRQIDADHPLFGEPHHFIGIIGYSHPYWVFLYYNDKKKDEKDLVEMRQILSSIRISHL